jgi:hypothetical protein
MRAFFEKVVSRNTTEQKTQQADIIYYEYTVRTCKILGITISKTTTTYDCTEKDDKSGIGFKNKK